MRLPRMTTRRWMVAVAVVALMLASALWVRRANEQRALAEQKALFEMAARTQLYYTMDVGFLNAIREIRAQPAEPLPDDFGPWFPVPPEPPKPK